MAQIGGEGCRGRAWRSHITHDPAVLRGKATIKGPRIAVDLVLHKLADSVFIADILAD